MARPVRRARETYAPARWREEGLLRRDSLLQGLTHALHRGAPAVLVHGPVGIGKSALLRDYLSGDSRPDVPMERAFWFAFERIFSVEHVLQRLTERIQGVDARLHPMEEKLEATVHALRETPYLLVWDGLESSHDLLSSEERAWLRRFLERLDGGATRVLITSQKEERWLEAARPVCERLRLDGLDAQERWTFYDMLLAEEPPKPPATRTDPDEVALMERLEGHPLLMRMVISRVKDVGTATVLAQLDKLLPSPAPGLDAKLTAALRLIDKAVPDDMRDIRVRIGQHERFIGLTDVVQHVAYEYDDSQQLTARFLEDLRPTGLVTPYPHEYFAVHPLLTGFWRSVAIDSSIQEEKQLASSMDQDAWETSKLEPVHQNFHVEYNVHNYRRAMVLAQVHGLDSKYPQIARLLVRDARYMENFAEARQLCLALAEWASNRSPRDEAFAFRQLGEVAEELGELEAAEDWCRKELTVHQGLKARSAILGCHDRLGDLALERDDFEAAESWHLRALALAQEWGDEAEQAYSLYNLGYVAEARDDLARAEARFLEALALEEKLDDPTEMASSCEALARVVRQRQDLPSARQWLLRALSLYQQADEPLYAARVQRRLGIVARQRGEHDESAAWLLQSAGFLAKADPPNPESLERARTAYLGLLKELPPERRAAFRERWSGAGLPPLPDTAD
ncbi:tetratricopeptide repeat protein [Myxococcus stipitatus]|uniref:tetratricopeptide repeat protein n=1 Tax=Myxococcus stipitatus TaxID=83455 RepID=UPI001F2C73CD|nr:tetratricopeptide repeat protein [Myxococcus stipitatus]MCE9667857.1 tetratricopeptide repeat protein [Myxococcus stipitatus]